MHLLRIRGRVLIPVQRVRIEPSRGCCGPSIQAFAEPRAIVVGERGCWRAFDPDGEELALEVLLEEVSGLAEAIEANSPLEGMETT
jgi:hypothetical protein